MHGLLPRARMQLHVATLKSLGKGHLETNDSHLLRGY